jgi:O-antigen/teichoic acid export membrane protein
MTIAETSLRPSADREGHLRTDDLMDDLGRRTARGGVVTIFSQGTKFFLGIVGTVILARLLTPEDYGLVGMVGVVTGFISVFKDLGLSAATIQKAEVSNEQISTLFWLNVFLSVGIMLVTAALAPGVAWFYGEPKLTGITLAYAAGFLFGGLAVQHEALLRRRMRFVALAVAEIVSLVVGSVVAITLAWHGARYWALVASQLCLGLTYVVVVWVTCRWRPGLPVKNSGVRPMLAFGGNLTAFSVMNYFARNLDNMLIGRYWGSAALGLYGKAYQLLLLPIDQINTPITTVAVPALSRLVHTPDRYRKAYLRMLEKLTMITMPLVAFMIVTSDWLVKIVLGPQWVGVTPIFMLLGIAGLIQTVTNTTGWLFTTQGTTRTMFHLGIINSLIAVAAIIVGLRWGPVGVAASYGLSDLFIRAPLMFWFIGRKGPIRMFDFYRTIAPSALVSVTLLVVLFALRRGVTVTSPLVGISVWFIVTLAVATLMFLLVPSGRRALADYGRLITNVATKRV